MRKIEALILGMFFGAVPVLGGFLVACLIHIIFFEEKMVPVWTLWGVAGGIVIDIVFLKRWVGRAYQINNKALAIIYLFCSVVALGMGMGVPLFNFALGIAAGVYSARRMHFAGADEESRQKYFKKTAVLCAVVMAMMCCLITLWAIAGQMIGYRFETPVLSFTFTVPVFTAVVLTGGLALVLLQYWLTKTAAKVTVILEKKKMFVKVLTVVMVLLAAGVVVFAGWIVLEGYHANKRKALQQSTQTIEHKSTRANTDL